jgi:Holliday junction resolvase RusA-like endonuclease
MKFTLPLPPSSNHIYINVGKGRTLSKEARAYKTQNVSKIVRSGGWKEKMDKNAAYSLRLIFYFPQVETKKWVKSLKKNGISEDVNRWTRLDLSNRIKLLEDTIVEALGVDDSAFFDMQQVKRLDPDNPRVDVEVTLMEDVCGRKSHRMPRTSRTRDKRGKDSVCCEGGEEKERKTIVQDSGGFVGRVKSW